MLVTRFAPSPTGRLHLGHAFSALTAFDAAQAAGGRFLLRIEDIDAGRCRPEHETGLLEDLAWLGLRWETPVRRQSEHLSEYAAGLAVLQAQGLVYRCFRTRREVAEAIASAPHGPMEAFRAGPLPPAEERVRLDAGEAFAWRLHLAAARAQTPRLTFREEGEGPDGEHGLIPVSDDLGGDVVLARKDLGVAYHLAVVVDDALQGVTHVIRGQDLFQAAHVQRRLQALLGLPEPVYRHHRLVTDEAGERLAKRRDAETLQTLRARGVSPADLRASLGL